MRRLIDLVNPALEHLGFRLVRTTTLNDLYARNLSDEDVAFLNALPPAQLPSLLEYWSRSHSQFGQDLFALAELGFPRGGFFVDFGATDGVEGSNSWLMEKAFGWRGIVAEPAHIWHDALRKNRSCMIDTRCVYSESGAQVEFSEVAGTPALSTIRSYASGDFMAGRRSTGNSYLVPTISLNDLLAAHGAPDEIDYLSIDTEGSELEILSRFDFGRYRFRVITCEHNHTSLRAKVHELLTGHGYIRKLERFSAVDDWYVLA